MDVNMAMSQLSEETKLIIKDNGFTFDMIQQFSPDDINEFPNMKDRFILRQIVKASTCSTYTNVIVADNQVRETTAVDTEVASSQSTDEADKLDSSSGSLMDTSLITAICNDFTAEQLLEKKRKNCQSTKAQSFFSSLIKDSAKGANIWKKSPLLTEISTSKRVAFQESIKRAAPQLNSIKYQAEVWKRLGQCLQNRRKYVNDIVSGKRLPRMSRSSTPNKIHKGKTSSYLQILNSDGSQGEEPMNVFVPGSNVVLLDKQNREVAKAIVVGNKDKMFTEVVIQNLLVDDNDTDENLELPQACGLLTKLCKGVIKKLVIWKTNRIQPAITINEKKKKSDEKSQPAITINEKKKKSAEKSNNKKPHHDQPAHVSNKPHQHMSACVGQKNTTTYCLAVFEWSNGELYIGYQKILQSHSVITNCQMPLARIDKGKLVLPKKIDSAMMKLNLHDIKKKPDDDYCIFRSAQYQLDSLSNMFVVANEQGFLERLCDGFAEYMKKN